jgi:hypothetical protein
VEFLARALTIYAWYVATVSVILGVLLTVLYVAHHVRKWRKRHWFDRRIPGATLSGNSDTLASGFAPGKLKIPSDRRSDGA